MGSRSQVLTLFSGDRKGPKEYVRNNPQSVRHRVADLPIAVEIIRRDRDAKWRRRDQT